MKMIVCLALCAAVMGAGAKNSHSQAKKAEAKAEPVEGLTETGQKVIWAGFAGTALPALYFAYTTLNKPASNDKKYHIYTTFICTIAALAYMTMATGHGTYTRLFDGREFFYARYIDWTLTTPLMLVDILGLAGANADTTNLLIGADILMIISGLIGAFLEGQEKYYFWGFGMVMFAPIVYYLNALKGPSGTTLYKISLITLITWMAYPIVWVAAEGENMITGDQEAMAYTILDVVAKSVFGFIIISARDSSASASATATASSSAAAAAPAVEAGSML
jgi:bacteriorhodopsin